MRWLAHPDRDVYCTGQVLNLIIGGRDVRSAILSLSQVSAGHATPHTLVPRLPILTRVLVAVTRRRRIWLPAPRESPSTCE